MEQCLLHIRVFFGGKTKSPYENRSILKVTRGGNRENKRLKIMGPVYKEKNFPGKRGNPPSQVNFSERLYEKKMAPLPEPRADISACVCSDCLALTELTRLGKLKFSYGEKLAWQGE